MGNLSAWKNLTPRQRRELWWLGLEPSIQTLHGVALKVGDILKSQTGKLRIVRNVSHRGGHSAVEFAIMRCSRYHRPTTTYPIRELELMGYRKVGHTRLRSKFDKLLAEDCECLDRKNLNFTCCDVRGIP